MSEQSVKPGNEWSEGELTALGLTPEEVAHYTWCAGGVKAARAFLGAGMSTSDVIEWRNATSASFPSIAAWYRTGLGLYRAGLWREWRVAPAAAARYHAAGWDVAEVADHDPDELVCWMGDLEEEHPGWEDWLKVKTLPAVVMVAADAGLHAGDLRAMLRVTRDPAILIHAIKNGRWAREEHPDACWPTSDFGAIRNLAAELQANGVRLALGPVALVAA